MVACVDVPFESLAGTKRVDGVFTETRILLSEWF